MEISPQACNLPFKGLNSNQPTNTSLKSKGVLNKQIEGIESNMTEWILNHYNKEQLPI